jgi:putative flippase GtrA
MKMSKLIIQLFRYSFFGILINLIGYSIYLFMTYEGLPPKIVMSFLYAISVLFGFLLNRKWTFKHKGNFLNTGTRYIISHALGYLVNLSILVVMVDKFGYSHQWVQAISIIIVAFFLFLIFKFFVFKPTERSNLEYK